MWQIWLIAAGVFFIAEIITLGFLMFWLGVGALLAMVVSFFIDNIIIQATVFVISSAILILGTKPFVDKFVNNKKSVKTNVYSMLGQEGLVTQDINLIKATGQVNVNGEIWSATCKGTTTIPQGTAVKVLKVRGVKLLVEPIKEKSTVTN